MRIILILFSLIICNEVHSQNNDDEIIGVWNITKFTSDKLCMDVDYENYALKTKIEFKKDGIWTIIQPSSSKNDSVNSKSHWTRKDDHIAIFEIKNSILKGQLINGKIVFHHNLFTLELEKQ